jgi:hypothetical protein
MGKIRGTHSSPGVYTKFTDLSYAAKTLGVTTLGIAGETLKGPAFEPILVQDYNQFRDYFGGTSAEKFKDSQYPKYQLPYIAKSYLSASDRLYVCRVLGLSGYNAGPAFLITATDSAQTETHVIAVLRSRGVYKKYANVGTECNPISKYDTLQFACDKVTIEPYTNVSVLVNCGSVTATTASTETYPINAINYGQFTLVAHKFDQEKGEYVEVGRYPVSLNAGTKDYIYNVLGSKASEGTSAIFVEELYDVMLDDLITRQKVSEIGGITVTGTSGTTRELKKVNELVISAVADPVKDFVTIPETSLTRKQLGQTFICAENGEEFSGDTGNGFVFHITNSANTITSETSAMTVGSIYTVKSFIDPTNGVKKYIYVELKDESGSGITVESISAGTLNDTVKAVKVLEYDAFVCLDKDENDKDILVPLNDMSDYHDQFRCASTPWVVSELKGDGKNLQVKKLFRFHTISDGTESNTEVKISIANIRPDDGRFDVYVRDFGDSDGNVTILESFKNLTMVPGDPKYIGLQIGTLDGAYELKSKFIMVEVIENDMTQNCVPCGFLGYPVRDYSDKKEGTSQLIAPSFKYNTILDDDIKAKRQYFGLSDLTGIDTDMLSYKGKNAYTDEFTHGYTHPFHLDSTLSDEIKQELSGITITIDGDLNTSSITWDCVSVNNTPVGGSAPVIGSEQDMEDTIYADKALRKFTMCFYGGFDGWDIYRNARTNTDEFKANKYKGTIKNGYGQTFSKIQDGTSLALEGNCITSDYYAFLAGYNQFEIPEKYIINLFATPGIDYVNNTLLVEDALDMIEEKRQDTLYVVDTPDKPWGASDAIDEMYSSADAAENLEDVGIDTYYACTYYPWVKFFDSENNIFINLPATKDVLRNMADVDNKKFPWYAPAGIERGKVDCTRMHFFAKLEDEDNVYDGRINPLKTFSQDGVKVWGNKTMYTGDTPMNRVNTVRLMLYMRKLIIESTRVLLFEPNDTTLKAEFEDIVNPILAQIKRDRGITDYRLDVEQTPEMMDAHEIQCKLWVKPTPTLEYIEIEFMVTPQGVSFSDI